jgi:hypothetical protein
VLCNHCCSHSVHLYPVNSEIHIYFFNKASLFFIKKITREKDVLRLFKNQNLLDLVVRRNKEKLEKMDMEIDMEIEGVDEREQDGE